MSLEDMPVDDMAEEDSIGEDSVIEDDDDIGEELDIADEVAEDTALLALELVEAASLLPQAPSRASPAAAAATMEARLENMVEPFVGFGAR